MKGAGEMLFRHSSCKFAEDASSMN
jgi:hypothetical protein